MARQPQVTRTIITTNVTALVVNTAERTTKEVALVLPRTYKDEKSLLKALNKSTVLAGDERIVSVIATEEVETLYGMSEQKFIENAEILPARTKNNTDTETENN